MRKRGRGGRVGTALGIVVAGVVAVGGGTADASGAAAGDPQRVSPAPAHQVTLLTGDRVMVGDGGRPSVQVLRGPGRATVPYAVKAYGGHVFVEPADAARLIAAGRLDERLFDVTGLAAQGYDDAHAAGIPVIAKGAVLPYGHGTMKLPALGMSATRVPKSDAGAAWRDLTAGAAEPSTFATATTRIWLDARLRVTDDVSARQVGAPAAWRKGLSGDGVTVAVLDSGYDTAHPDLTGVVTRSRGFTDQGAADVTDRNGHGTHVASILAGSGAASHGRYRGIAPGARLAVGKVCDDTGGCASSWVLAGMAWAARTVKARVVNLSLGGTDAPGVDPLEEAVDTLTAQTGTLFVVAAGNDGRDRTIESPGSADAALTIGAVDSHDRLAAFSSRGPRAGDDYAVKPDLTAPGVDIVAAKAAGSDLGPPVGRAYQRLSGTSMAAPHVAAAAAILAQQHPGWRAVRLKAALTGSARPGADRAAYHEGTGRLDIARAVTQQVTATPTGMSAALAWPHTAGQSAARTYAYTNDGTAPIRLALRTSGVPSGLVRLNPSSLTLRPGATAKVTATIGADGVTPGTYSGLITATSAGRKVMVRTAVGAYIEPEAYDVTVSAIGRDGQPNDTQADFFDPATGDVARAQTTGGTGTVRLLAKRYIAHATVFTNGTDVSNLLEPYTVGAGDRRFTFDARAARPATVTIDRADATAKLDAITAYNGRGGAFVGIGSGPPGRVSVLPVKDPGIVFNLQSLWTRRDATETDPSPYRYDLADVVRGQVPADPVYHHTTAGLAAIHVDWRTPGAATVGSHVWAPVLPDVFLSLGTGIPMRLPATQTEYVTPRLAYGRSFYYGPDDWHLLQAGTLAAPDASYTGTSNAETWDAAAIGPDFPGSGGGDRTGDVLTYGGDGLFSDAGSGHVGRDMRATGTVRLARGSTVVKTAQLGGGYAALAARLPARPATYTLSVSARRPVAPSTAVTTTWTFRSRHTAKRRPLPLQAVRFAVPGLDDANQAEAGATLPISVEVARNPGAPPAPVASLTVRSSTDDGTTWRNVPVTRSRRGWVATVTDPATAGYVSLRATATDRAGNAVDQTIIRAYAVR